MPHLVWGREKREPGVPCKGFLNTLHVPDVFRPPGQSHLSHLPGTGWQSAENTCKSGIIHVFPKCRPAGHPLRHPFAPQTCGLQCTCLSILPSILGFPGPLSPATEAISGLGSWALESPLPWFPTLAKVELQREKKREGKNMGGFREHLRVKILESCLCVNHDPATIWLCDLASDLTPLCLSFPFCKTGTILTTSS